MQDIIDIREKLVDIVVYGNKDVIYVDLVKLIVDMDIKIREYDRYMDQMALEQEKHEDRVAAAA